MSPFPKQAGAFPGAPTVVTHANPLLSNQGPASYADRKDEPDLTVHGTAKIVPLRSDASFFLEPRDPDYRSMPVLGSDFGGAGHVRDIWVDRAEPQVRYLEVELADGSRRVLLPVTNVQHNRRRGFLYVKSITAAQFAEVPGTRHAERVTLLEEDRIQAYYAGGYMFGELARRDAAR
jgi:photosynthetic reaction center H subunit